MVTDLLNASRCDISSSLPGKLVSSTLSAARSSNKIIREKSVSLMLAIFARCDIETTRVEILAEISSLPRSGKTSSTDHRACLYDMIASAPTSNSISVQVVDSLLPLISKENNDAVLDTLCSAIEGHLAHLLVDRTPLTPSASAALEGGLSATKLSTRRAVSRMLGNAAWRNYEARLPYSPEGIELLRKLSTALGNCLKSAVSNQPSNVGGYLEGYVAGALALGPMQTFHDPIKSLPVNDLLATEPRPSFLLSERFYSRLIEDSDEIWMCRCLEAAVVGRNLGKSAAQR